MKTIVTLCLLLLTAVGCAHHRAEVKVSVGSDDPYSWDTGVSVKLLPGSPRMPGPMPLPGGGLDTDDPNIRHDLFVMLESACREIDSMDRMMNEIPTGDDAHRRLEEKMDMSKEEIDQMRRRICEETPRSMTTEYLRIELRMLDQLMAAYAGALDQPRTGLGGNNPVR